MNDFERSITKTRAVHDQNMADALQFIHNYSLVFAELMNLVQGRTKTLPVGSTEQLIATMAFLGMGEVALRYGERFDDFNREGEV